jgi:hypothetical protein
MMSAATESKENGSTSSNAVFRLLILGCMVLLGLIRAPHMKMMVLREDTTYTAVSSSQKKSIPQSINRPLLFHFTHTSDETSFGIRQFKSIESVFYHHPDASVVLTVRAIWKMTTEPLLPLIRKGYNLTLKSIDLMEEVKLLEAFDGGKHSAIAAASRDFLTDWESHLKTKYWKYNVSNLLRLILLFKYGGIYMGTKLIQFSQKDDDALSLGVVFFERTNLSNSSLQNYIRYRHPIATID